MSTVLTMLFLKISRKFAIKHNQYPHVQLRSVNTLAAKPRFGFNVLTSSHLHCANNVATTHIARLAQQKRSFSTELTVSPSEMRENTSTWNLTVLS